MATTAAVPMASANPSQAPRVDETGVSVSGSVIHHGSAAQRLSGSAVQWFSGSAIQGLSVPVTQRSVIQWCSGGVAQWRSGELSG